MSDEMQYGSDEAAADAAMSQLGDQGREREDKDRRRSGDRDRRRSGDRDRDRRRSGDRDRREGDRDRERDDRDRDRRRSRDRDDRRDRDRDRDRRDRSRDRGDGRGRGRGSLADELRQDRGEDRRDDRPAEAPADSGAGEKRRKSKWSDEPPDELAGVPDWLKDQFFVPKPPPEPIVSAGQRKVRVPQHTVGRVLGKMGATINEIQEAAGCDIKMNQDTKELGYSFAICTSLKNNQADLDKAEMLINEKIAGAPAARAAAAPLPTPQGGETKEIRVEKQYVGMLIGKGGETIRLMQAEAGCQIQIDQSDPGEYASITFGPGSSEQVARGEKVVMDKIAEKQGNQGGYGGGMGVKGGPAQLVDIGALRRALGGGGPTGTSVPLGCMGACGGGCGGGPCGGCGGPCGPPGGYGGGPGAPGGCGPGGYGGQCGGVPPGCYGGPRPLAPSPQMGGCHLGGKGPMGQLGGPMGGQMGGGIQPLQPTMGGGIQPLQPSITMGGKGVSPLLPGKGGIAPPPAPQAQWQGAKGGKDWNAWGGPGGCGGPCGPCGGGCGGCGGCGCGGGQSWNGGW